MVKSQHLVVAKIEHAFYNKIKHQFEFNNEQGGDLMDEYQIIAVDFDGTLCYSEWPALGEPNT